MSTTLRRMLVTMALLVLAGPQLGCSTLLATGIEKEPPRQIDVLYGTDRATELRSEGVDDYYGKYRGPFSLGVISAVIDRSQGRKFVHSIAAQGGFSLGRSERFVTLESIELLDEADFIERLNTALDQSREKDVLIYVHGYARSFTEAVSRASVFVERSGFEGVTLVWSWPSLGNAAAYVADSTNMTWSIPHLGRFLELVARGSNAQRVIIAAHSMGTYQVTQYLARAGEHPGMAEFLSGGELILIAPDIDADIFERDLAPALIRVGMHITVYASSQDHALRASTTLHTYPRIGDSEGGLRLIPGIDVIDVTRVNASFLGHTYHERSAPVLTDIGELIGGLQNPSDRTHLLEVQQDGMTYWELH